VGVCERFKGHFYLNRWL